MTRRERAAVRAELAAAIAAQAELDRAAETLRPNERDDTGGVPKRELWKRLNGHAKRKRRNSQTFA